jgi:hypothetical protein
MKRRTGKKRKNVKEKRGKRKYNGKVEVKRLSNISKSGKIKA